MARTAAAVGDSKIGWTCEILWTGGPLKGNKMLQRHDMFQCSPQNLFMQLLVFVGKLDWMMRMLKPQRLHRACHPEKRLGERPGHTLEVFVMDLEMISKKPNMRYY